MALIAAPELLALGTAATTALSGMLVSEAFASASVMTVTRWNVVVSFLLQAAIATAIGSWGSLDANSIRQLMLSGLFAIVIAAPVYYGSLAMLGPRAGVLVFSLNAPLTFLIGVPLLGEHPGPRALAGVALVLAGLAVATWPRNDGLAVPAGHRWLGIGLGLIGALGQAGGTVAARPAMLAGADPFAAMAVRFGIAAAVLVALQATPLARHFRASSASLRPLAVTFLGSLIGNGVGMTLMMVALAHAEAGVVATFAATSPILILPMVWLRRGEAPAAAAWLGAAATFAGTALVLLR